MNYGMPEGFIEIPEADFKELIGGIDQYRDAYCDVIVYHRKPDDHVFAVMQERAEVDGKLVDLATPKYWVDPKIMKGWYYSLRAMDAIDKAVKKACSYCQSSIMEYDSLHGMEGVIKRWLEKWVTIYP